MLSWGLDQIVIVYVPRACPKKNLESIPPIILVLGHIFLVFGYFEPIQALFEPPDPDRGYSKPGQIVNVYVPRACTKKSLLQSKGRNFMITTFDRKGHMVAKLQ